MSRVRSAVGFILLTAIMLALAGCSSTQQAQIDQMNAQIAQTAVKVAAQQACVQAQEVTACGPAAASVLPMLIAGGAGAAVAGTTVGACAFLHLPASNQVCGVGKL